MTVRRPIGRRAVTILAVLGLSAVGLGFIAPRTAADAAAPTVSVTVKKTVTRTITDASGATRTVDSRNVSVTVSQTVGLRSLQLTRVTWAGAHPTGGIVPDQNSDIGQNEEYPMALFECRGTDTIAHPLTPETCWTQYAGERFSYGSDDPAYPAWRSDANAPESERQAFVNRPTGAAFTNDCRNDLFGSTYERWVPFEGADGQVYPGGLFGCAGQPAEASPINASSSQALPSNETYGVTGADGSGSANFDIFTAEDHASLGCSASVPCSLVAVPIMGISCDAYGTKLSSPLSADDAAVAAKNCEGTGNFAPGATLTPGNVGDPAVDARLWWSASNWKNRLAVPLQFGAADNICSLQSSTAPLDVYGSELMTQATTNWAPYFCLNPKLFPINHVQTPEPQARNLLQQGTIEAAYTSNAPDMPYPHPTVNAPVALSGYGIAATVDDAQGRQVTGLRLNARLIAKLLTESYPAILDVHNEYGALSKNPLNISLDPEFRALNPDVPTSSQIAAATLLTVSSDSDVMYALTSYVNADPEARAWINGKPDPWGMTVNPNYAKIALPVTNWPLLDTFALTRTNNSCLSSAPTPFLPLVAAPTARFYSIAQAMQFAVAQNQTTCTLVAPDGSATGSKLSAEGRQGSGKHFMLGVVSLGDAARDGLTLASLQTQSSVSPDAQFTNADGRTFAGPDTMGLTAAGDALVPNNATGTWSLPYATLRTSAAGVHAYPGAMLVNAAIPTQSLPVKDASQYAAVLRFAAGRGQQPGVGQGDLPSGYLPLTTDNHLKALAAYTLLAADAVAAQKGTVPALVPSAKPKPSGGTVTPPPGGSSATTSSSGGGSGTDAGVTGSSESGGGNMSSSSSSDGAHGPSAAVKGRPQTAGASSAAPGSVAASPVAARTPSYGSSTAGALPFLLGGAIVLLVVALVVRLQASGRRSL